MSSSSLGRVRGRGFGWRRGWELDFVLLTAALALVFLGAGAISLDRV